MRNFLTDKYFFLKYFSSQMLIMLALAAIVVSWRGISFDYEFSLIGLYFLPLSFVFGVQVPVVLHNAVHFNIPHKLINEIVGELCGFFVLFGMAPFRISHTLHHAYPDDPEKDPHPPMGKGFLYFLSTTQLNTIRVISNVYFRKFGRGRDTYSIMATQMVAYYIGLVSRVVIWYSLLGPNNFVNFFIPAYLTNLIVFAHINFATHQPDGKDDFEVINLDHNLYYKTLNILSSGAYYHKNHHDFPKRYNPMIASSKSPKQFGASLASVFRSIINP